MASTWISRQSRGCNSTCPGNLQANLQTCSHPDGTEQTRRTIWTCRTQFRKSINQSTHHSEHIGHGKSQELNDWERIQDRPDLSKTEKFVVAIAFQLIVTRQQVGTGLNGLWDARGVDGWCIVRIQDKKPAITDQTWWTGHGTTAITISINTTKFGSSLRTASDKRSHRLLLVWYCRGNSWIRRMLKALKQKM